MAYVGKETKVYFYILSFIQVQIQAQIDDSHVVKILDTVSATETRQLFIIMEYCEGGNLLQWIRRNRKHKMLNETVSVSSLEGIYIRKH